MRAATDKILSLVVAALILLLATAPLRAQSTDPDVRFVEALRAGGFHELAIDYLDRAAQGGVVTDVLRERIAYELAVTRLEQAKMLPGAQRDQAVSRAQRDLESFIGSTDNKELVAEGSGRLAAAMADQGARLTARADLLGTNNKSEKSRLLQDARKAYDNARRLYGQAVETYRTALEEYKAVAPGSPAAQERQSLRRRMTGDEVRAALALHQKAKTYGAKSKQSKSLNEEAAGLLLDLYDRDVNDPISMYAHLYEGWCYQAMGDHKLAKGCFEELVIQDPSVPVFREIITLAHAYQAVSLMVEQKFSEALDGGTEWLDELKPNEAPAATAALQYQMGEAARRLAAKTSGAEETRLLTRARQLLQDSSRVRGEFQADARLRLAEVTEQLGDAAKPPETFAEAAQAGKDAISAMNAAKLAAKVAANNNPKKVAGLRRRIEEKTQEAHAAFEQALTLVDDETDVATLNEVRYFLSWLYWEQDQPLRSAALGQFVAMSYADDPSAEGAAKLAMAAFERLYNDAYAAGDASFESAQLRRIAQFAAKRWAGGPTGDLALSVVMNLALKSGDVEQARSVLDQAPAANRAAMSLKIANAMWEQAVRQTSAAGSDPTAQREALRAKSDALALLRESFPKARAEGFVSSSLATSALYFAQALLDEGDANAAVKLLEDKKVGPLKLIAQKSEAVARPGYATNAYQIALRAYVATNPPRTDDALRMMDRLEKEVGGAGRANLTRVYLGLGVQLQAQIAELQAAGKRAAADRLIGAFTVFLDRLTERVGDADWVAQQWIGQTLMKLGEGLEAGGDADGARDKYARAGAVFQSMIDRAAAEPSFPPSANSVLAARMQLGQTQRKSGAHSAAIDTFSSILLERPVMLDVQKAAAYTYQEWGADSDPDHLITAIKGGRVVADKGENLIWGWSKLSKIAAKVARSRPEYKDLFFECWLNVATCRYLAAEQASGAERDKNLASARRTIRSMLRQYPDLGGPERRGDFDRLMKRIQRLEGKDAQGLAELSS